MTVNKPEILNIRWNKTLLAIIFVISTVVSIISVAVTSAREQTQQTDRLNVIERRIENSGDIGRRIELLEQIANTDTKSLTRLETQMEIVKLQHQEMLKGQSDLLDMIRAQNRRARKEAGGTP